MAAFGRKQPFIDSGLFRDLVMRRYPYVRTREGKGTTFPQPKGGGKRRTGIQFHQWQ